MPPIMEAMNESKDGMEENASRGRDQGRGNNPGVSRGSQFRNNRTSSRDWQAGNVVNMAHS